MHVEPGNPGIINSVIRGESTESRKEDMKLFSRRRKKEPDLPSKTQFRQTDAQGLMTPWFQDYHLRKVSGDFYEALREGIPIIDAGIRRLISLDGTIKIIGDNMEIVKALEDFNLNVPVNDTQTGIHAFLENVSNETFEQGNGIAEFIVSKDMKDIVELRVADSKDIVFRRNDQDRAEPWYRYPGNTLSTPFSRPESIAQRILSSTFSQSTWLRGMQEEKLNLSNKLMFSINNENTDPYGVSVMRSMEFVSKILMTIQNSILNVWERLGDPSFHVKYKRKGKLDGDKLEARRSAIATEFNTAVTAKREGRSADFINALDADSDITIEIIGADGKVLDMAVPGRHVLEQVVSKLGLPAWMLGLYWSTTERMAVMEIEAALQDAKIRNLTKLPQFIKLFSVFLRLRGFKWNSVTTDTKKPGDWGIIFETPNLRDLVAQAQARFLNAQADMMESGAVTDGNGTQTNVNVGAATYDIRGTKVPLISPRKTCKELTRPEPWPELDQVEIEFEQDLKTDWAELEADVLAVLHLTEPGKVNSASAAKAPEPPPVPEDAFTFSGEQKTAIDEALKEFLDKWDPKLVNDTGVLWHYGRAYSLGLLRAVELIGKERPILDIINNKHRFVKLMTDGFGLVKERATKRIVNKIIPEMEAGVTAGSNPRNVAARLKKLFRDANSDWERLARSEMTIAAETAKLDEFKEWEIETSEFTPAPDACSICTAVAGVYETKKCPVPVLDTHPRCRCSIRPGPE